MNKTAIKNFAVWAHENLVQAVKKKAFIYDITEDGPNDPDADRVFAGALSDEEKEQRVQLIEQMRWDGYEQMMEDAAYIWFNRFIALRYMEVNGFLPSKVRIFTNDKGEFQPEILKEALNIDLEDADRDTVIQLSERQSSEELYKFLLLLQLRKLSLSMPFLMHHSSDWANLLMPANLLRPDSVIARMTADIPEEDWMDAVQIVGWMYQFYISEKHDEIVDILSKKAVKKEDIPAATQLFTTDWVVRYMVDNSLGRYWIDHHPESRLADKLLFYIKPKNDEKLEVCRNIAPEELSFFDPCMGSGHILAYAFDVFMEIYRECGYTDRDAAKNILLYNLYGLDIDDRCSQLAQFSILMKARQYNRKILSYPSELSLFALRETEFMTDGLIAFAAGESGDLKSDLMRLRNQFKNAREFGSLIIPEKYNFKALYARIKALEQFSSDSPVLMKYRSSVLDSLLPAVRQADLLSRKYTAVCTNPPYMNKFESSLKSYLLSQFKDYAGDLFSAFMYRNFDFCLPDGCVSFMTPNVWMFIKRYKKLREFIIKNKSIVSLVQMAKGAFFKEATVDVCAFVIANTKTANKGKYIRLEAFNKGGMEEQGEKALEAIHNPECGYYYEKDAASFRRISGSPIAYWISDRLSAGFQSGEPLKRHGIARQGMATTDNQRFLRMWFEIDFAHIGFGACDTKCAADSHFRWFPYNKGGEYRKWYGNMRYAVDYYQDGRDIKNSVMQKYPYLKNPDFVVKNSSTYFHESISWSKISSGDAAFRYYPQGFIYDVSGCSIFYKDRRRMKYDLGFMNSKVAKTILEGISPTVNYETGHIASMPILFDESKLDEIEEIADRCILLAKADWDAFESSWNFQKHPLLRSVSLLSDAFALWQDECENRFHQLKMQEEKLNRIFIDIYHLQNELTPEADNKSISVRRADVSRDIRSFISYAVGCMFGRYSLHAPGLQYAGGDWDAFMRKNSDRFAEYRPDADGILPICEDACFPNDIVLRFIDFVKIAFGEETLEKNLMFIANALGGTGASRDRIRCYFNNEFFDDHCKLYLKRPIYWLFDSGKKNGFKAIVYVHRYTPDLAARLRTDYIHEMQSRYRALIMDCDQRMNSMPQAETAAVNKRMSVLREQAEELNNYEEKIHHISDQFIQIDLNDGIKANYAHFSDVLAKIK